MLQDLFDELWGNKANANASLRDKLGLPPQKSVMQKSIDSRTGVNYPHSDTTRQAILSDQKERLQQARQAKGVPSQSSIPKATGPQQMNLPLGGGQSGASQFKPPFQGPSVPPSPQMDLDFNSTKPSVKVPVNNKLPVPTNKPNWVPGSSRGANSPAMTWWDNNANVKTKAVNPASAAALGVTGLLHSPMLGNPEDNEEWVASQVERGVYPEGYTLSTVRLEKELTKDEGSVSEDLTSKYDAAVGKLAVLAEAGASQDVLDSVQKEINLLDSQIKSASGGGLTSNSTQLEKRRQELLAEKKDIDAKVLELSKGNMFTQLGIMDAPNAEDMNKILDNSGTFGVSVRQQMTNNAQALADLDKIQAMRKTTEDLQTKVSEDTEVQDLIAEMEKLGPEDPIDPNLGAEAQIKIEKASKIVTKGWFDGVDLSKMMSAAGDFLGDIWADPAVKSALTYYVGSRLMGYSASGSGMAAGEVYVKGVEQQNKIDVVNAKADKDAAIAAKKAAQPDMSKTVEMFDRNSKKIVSGNMAPNGDFYLPGSDIAFNAAKAGLVTYKSGLKDHRTFEEIDNDMITYSNDAVVDAISLLDEESFPYIDQVKRLFSDGQAVDSMVLHASRRLKEQGVDYGTTAFRAALSGTLKTEIEKIAKNGGTDTNESMMKDLIGAVEANWLKSNLLKQGAVPKFVLGKYTDWGKDGKGMKYDSDFELSSVDTSKLFKTASGINEAFLLTADEKYPKQIAKNHSIITQTKTIQKLAMIFKNEVMTNKAAAKHWQQIADKTDSNAFSSWLQSSSMDDAQAPSKYNGLNQESIMSQVEKLYDKQFKK